MSALYNAVKHCNTITPFQRRVYLALLEIPKGKVLSYGVLAQKIRCASCQAVGQALKANPFAPKVPCHRVIKTDGSIGGYQGTQSAKKIALLKKEGVLFSKGKLLDVNVMLTRF